MINSDRIVKLDNYIVFTVGINRSECIEDDIAVLLCGAADIAQMDDHIGSRYYVTINTNDSEGKELEAYIHLAQPLIDRQEAVYLVQRDAIVEIKNSFIE